MPSVWGNDGPHARSEESVNQSLTRFRPSFLSGFLGTKGGRFFEEIVRPKMLY